MNLIVKMLRENTGTHFLDSGSAYGRHWEKNQKLNLTKEPACQVEVCESGVSVNYDLYHFLNNFLERDNTSRILEKRFMRYANRKENEDRGWLQLMEDWAEKISPEDNHTENSYNFENLLSQVIQTTTFKYNDDDYLLLQIHNGCDVRGGYTKPHIFKISDIDYFALAMYDVHSGCNKCHTYWYSDDSGYHWYTDDHEKEVKWEDLKFDVEQQKVYCSCGGEVLFDVQK